jgi:hypothetical protein
MNVSDFVGTIPPGKNLAVFSSPFFSYSWQKFAVESITRLWRHQCLAAQSCFQQM